MNCKFVYQKTQRNCTNIATDSNGCCKTHSSYYNRINKKVNVINKNSTECISKVSNECISKVSNECSNEISNECSNECISEISNECSNEISNECISEISNECISEISNLEFIFNNHKFTYIIDDNIIWFNGKEIVTYIGYTNHNKAIKDHIKPKYIKALKNFGANILLPTKYNENSIYISEYGLYQLLTTSKLTNSIVITFQDTLYESILPNIRKIGLSSNMSASTSLSTTLITTPNTNNLIQLSLYDRKNVVYIGFISKDFDIFYKFGISSDIKTRNESHTKTFQSFNITYIKECNNNNYVENLFKNDLKNLNLLYQKDNYTELFKTTETYDISFIYNLLDNIILHHTISEKLEIRRLDLQIKQEETKQLELQFKIKQLDYL